ncbi:protein phosphatase 2C domain-containing protein [Candidatus Micrarchaeota archaeon]|nr:protein phosphatase 2C domain-containing protein [Candidatus Micrarchaeota archaeon]
MTLRKEIERAKKIRKYSDPFKRGRQLLLDAYQKTTRTGAFVDMLQFEMVRSIVIEQNYLSGTRENWLDVAKIDGEIRQADSSRRTYLQSVKSFIRTNAIGDASDFDRIAREAHGTEKFLSTSRQYLPGIGYGITLKKRRSPNQDWFLMDREGNTKLFAVCDGCGSQQFSSIATYLTLRELMQRKIELLTKPKPTICEISEEVRNLMRSMGSATLLMAIVIDETRKIYQVGDSIPLVRFVFSRDIIVEQVGYACPAIFVGQPRPLEKNDIVYHIRFGGKVILTTDGITNNVPRTNMALEQLYTHFSDAVVVAERLLRIAITRALKSARFDDMTIVVEE